MICDVLGELWYFYKMHVFCVLSLVNIFKQSAEGKDAKCWVIFKQLFDYL